MKQKNPSPVVEIHILPAAQQQQQQQQVFMDFFAIVFA